MIQRALIALASLALLATPACAQKMGPAPVTRAETPVSRTQAPDPAVSAARIIAAAGAEDLFTAAPNAPSVALHRASGLACDFSGDNAGGRILVFPGLPRGEDVGCNFSGEPLVTLYATRYRDGRNAEQDLENAIGAIAARFSEVRDFSPDAEISLEGAPRTYAAAFLVRDRGELKLTSVHIAVIDGWFYKMRYSDVIASDAEAADSYRAAQLVWNAALARLLAVRSL